MPFFAGHKDMLAKSTGAGKTQVAPGGFNFDCDNFVAISSFTEPADEAQRAVLAEYLFLFVTLTNPVNTSLE